MFYMLHISYILLHQNFFPYKIFCFLTHAQNRLILHNILNEIPKFFGVHRIHSRERTGKREFKINTLASIRNLFLYRHTDTNVDLCTCPSKQNLTAAAQSACRQTLKPEQTIHRLSICLEMGTNKSRIEGVYFLPKKLEKRCRGKVEDVYSFVSRLERHPPDSIPR